ncbi:Na+/H+ antiporter subunit E [Staphylococcus massiliensis]|uniref:Monovalent cation/H+ antiporter subunit E n=1 Tax=Staphylococcus massiliensis S46 TaxID=1229783 RepID=K9B2Q3_9STAP|nr:Na+/H+ antiporter subunit E [Staphylococcus massiliensis]EKU48040.1 monovalent cation/H+ antiporter subunit E [Staphylococcus massiliensis S46]MCG3400022.1 Na+/H+ antiporter subunit E [Staphylococcus massiliensis]MCG3401649.1 Na+/H+ antiporter subunit E [Staphylococcus massiliensis]MCG3412183.1 Na+/H+ antiporter subunit E [Staphylococcus massiliensis]POA00070.1 Na+/H+ antiporter subunit E [Staphylococcus massiliensis CCUG 55927]
MAIQIVINIFLAVFWMFLSDSYTLNNFVLGFLFSLAFVYLMRHILPGRFYMITLYRIFKLILIFLLELLKANVDVIRIIFQPKIQNEPAFFEYETELKKDWEIVLLANLITLTPGTVVLGVSDDRKKLYIHCVDFSTKEEEVEGIKTSLEKAVREVGEL